MKIYHIIFFIIIGSLIGCANTYWKPDREPDAQAIATKEYPVKNKEVMVLVVHEAMKRAGITETNFSKQNNLFGGSRGMNLLSNSSGEDYILSIKETNNEKCVVSIWVYMTENWLGVSKAGMANAVFDKIQGVLNDAKLMGEITRKGEEEDRIRKEQFDKIQKQIENERQSNIEKTKEIINSTQQSFDANEAFNIRSKIILEEMTIFINLCTNHLRSYATVWSNAIDSGQDFNKGLLAEFTRLEVYGHLESVRIGHEHIAKLMKSIEPNLPNSDKEIFNLLLESYAIYSESKELTLSPKGALIDFNKKVNDLESQYSKIKSKLEILLSQGK